MNSEQSSTTPTGPLQDQGKAASVEDAGLDFPKNAVSKYNPNKSTAEERALRRERVWHMRIVERKSIRQIAEATGFSFGAIRQDLKSLYKKHVQNLGENHKEIIAEQNTILVSLLNKWLPVAVGEHGGDVQERIAQMAKGLDATDRVLKILNEQAKLHGIASDKKAPTAAEIGKELGSHVLNVMTALAQGKMVRAEVIEGEVVQPQLNDAKSS